MKKFFSIIFIYITIIIGYINVSSNYYPDDTNIQFSYDINNSEVTILFGTAENIIIPDYIEGYPVTKIASKAFTYILAGNNHYTPYKSITKLPETLITIEDEAFSMYLISDYREVTIPKSVQNIGVHAFGYYKELISTLGGGESFIYTHKMDDFTIKGYKGTAAETYAKENGFKFVALDDEPQVTTATTATTQTTTTSTTVSTTSTSKATTETTKVTTSTTLTTTTSATTVTTNSTTTISTSASTSASSTSGSTTNLTTPLTKASTSVTTSETTTVITNIKGDANGDNKLDVRDAAFIAQKIALDKAAELPKCADFNDDGTVNVRDAAAIARYLASNVKK